jgi:clan AA aspartic protease (TIGR02281 family)
MADLAAFLTGAGYRQVPLSRNGVGHFQASGSVAGHPVAVLVDTGAASTVLELAVARRLGLDLVKLDVHGAGAGGGGLEVFLVQGGQLSLGTVVPRPRALLAVDLTHVNQALALKGATGVEAILGIDVFEAHAAVIDYGSQSLFLRE